MTSRAARLPDTVLMLVTDRHRSALPLVEAVAKAVEGGVNVVQLREKDLCPRELADLALEVKGAIAGRALLVINDRLDVALAVGADGVQLGRCGLPPALARRAVGDGLLLGRSVHSAREAREAAAEGADYLVVGTIFETPSHPQVKPAGLRLLREARAEADAPLIAIGGITEANARGCLRAGASGVAAISAILCSEDPRAAAAGLLQAARGCCQ